MSDTPLDDRFARFAAPATRPCATNWCLSIRGCNRSPGDTPAPGGQRLEQSPWSADPRHQPFRPRTRSPLFDLRRSSHRWPAQAALPRRWLGHPGSPVDQTVGGRRPLDDQRADQRTGQSAVARRARRPSRRHGRSDCPALDAPMPTEPTNSIPIHPATSHGMSSTPASLCPNCSTGCPSRNEWSSPFGSMASSPRVRSQSDRRQPNAGVAPASSCPDETPHRDRRRLTESESGSAAWTAVAGGSTWVRGQH